MRVAARIMHFLGALAERLRSDTGGGIAMMAALAGPAVLLLGVGAIDLLAVSSAQSRLQSIADAAALAGAPQLALATDGSAAKARAATFVAAEVSQWNDAPSYTGTYEVIDQGGQRAIRVTLNGHRPSFFANMLPPGGWDFTGKATATSVGLVPLCVLNIAHAGDGLLELATRSRIEAPECLVHSNHTITVKDRSELIGKRIQAVGRATGTIIPMAGTGAARIEDPFAGLDLDDPGGKCSEGNFDRAARRIRAGIHCAISISGNGTYTLEPGEHWFTGGRLSVLGKATLVGEDVVLLVGKAGGLDFNGDARVNLIGRKSGPYAGVVVAALRDHDELISINSTRVERLEGAIYVPNAILEISGTADVARQSAWTVVVAASLMLNGSPRVYINANYGASDVPVPAGVGAQTGGTRLIQ